MQNMHICQRYKVCYFFSIFSVCTKLQRSLTTWGRYGEGREGRQKNKKETEREITIDPNEVLYSMRHMTHFYYNMLLCVSPVGTVRLDGAVGERRGVGWVQQYIPEYMTRCSRSDRSQPWLMKPKHFHRCFDTLGSTSPPQPNSTPPTPSFSCPPRPHSALKSFHLLS